MYYQQGDVIMELIQELPDGLKECKTRNDEYILAEGEVTGHCHSVASSDAVLMEDDNGAHCMTVNTKTATIKHQEHGKIDVLRGNYKVRQVREYDHFAEEARAVKD